MAEAYNDYFTVKTTAHEVLALGDQPLFPSLLHAGFNAVDGHDVYRVIKEIYYGSKWANNITRCLRARGLQIRRFTIPRTTDEVRLASPYSWGGIGSAVGRAASAVLYGIRARSGIGLYNGQEVGKPAIEAVGLQRGRCRTTLFDYWSLPELSKWVNRGAFDAGLLSISR